MKNFSIFELQIEKHYAYKKKNMYSLNSLVSGARILHDTRAHAKQSVIVVDMVRLTDSRSDCRIGSNLSID